MQPRYPPRVGSTRGGIETPTAGEGVYEAQVVVGVLRGCVAGEGRFLTSLS